MNMKKIFITITLSAFIFAIILAGCSKKKSSPSSPEQPTATLAIAASLTNTPVITLPATRTATGTITISFANTATATVSPTATQVLPVYIDNFEDGDMKDMILSDAGYNGWTTGTGSGGVVNSYGTVATGGGAYGSYAGYVSGTATTSSGGGGSYMGLFSIGAYTYTQMSVAGYDFSPYSSLHFSAAFLASAPISVTYQIQITIMDLNYDYVTYVMPSVPGAAFQDFVVNKSSFTPQGSYTVDQVLSNAIIIQWGIAAISPNQNDVATIGFYIDNIFWQ